MVTFELKTLTDYSDEAILAELRRVAAVLGDKPVTVERFKEVGRVGVTTVRRRFGSWDNALTRAGLEAQISTRPINLTRDLVLGSGLIDYSQKMTMAAMQMADMKVCAHRS